MLELAGRSWRIAATAMCFSLFGLGGLAMRVAVFPLLAAAVRDPQRRAAACKLVIRGSLQLFVGTMRRVGVLTYETSGLDKLQRPGLLILANHPSLIDVVFLIALVGRPDCVVKGALARNPFTRGPVRAAGFICNDAGPEMVADCIASLQAGNHLIIFPEGTRTPVDRAARLQRGAANVAVRGRFDVTPVMIHCDPPTLTKGAPWWRVPRRRPHFRIEVHDDLPVAPLAAGCASDALAARRLTNHLAAYFSKETGRDYGHANA